MRHVLTGRDRPDPATMGGKAAALARLGDGFPVPPWFVVSPAAFSGGALRPEAAAEVREALGRLGDGPFAVRSSGVEEDGQASSFAGQLDSHLNVGRDRVEEHVLKVHRSAFSDGARAYRRERGLEGDPPAPAVLVQDMVDASVSGVAFGADPVHSRRDRVVVVATRGLAADLVGGKVDGDQYTLTRDGETVSERTAGDTPVLDAPQVRQVARLCLRAEEVFSCPQDIEWAFDGDRLHIVQSRPITTLSGGEGARTIWDNSNIVESYSGVTSPLTFSFASHTYAEVYRAFALVMGVPRRVVEANRNVFANMLGHINGHVYYNLPNWYRVLSLLPGFRVNRGFMEQMMGVREPLPPDVAAEIVPGGAGVAERGRDAARLLWTCCRLVANCLTLGGKVRRFHRRLDRVLGGLATPLPEMDETGLAGHYRDLERDLLAQWQPPIINDFLCMVACGMSRRLLERWCGEDRGRALHNDFMIGQGDIISAEPARRIRRMADIVRGDGETVRLLLRGERAALERDARLAEAFREYLGKFGDRCVQELKLESRTLRDDPSSLLKAVGNAATGAPGESRPAAGGRAEADLRAALGGGAARAWVALALTRWAKARVRDRENLRFERTRVFGRVREIFLCLGRRLAARGLLRDPRDVFFLQVDEALGAVEGTVVTQDLRALADIRKREAGRFEGMPEMPGRFETRGAVLPGILGGLPASPGDDQGGGASRTGIGCCVGVVRARARVVLDPRGESLRPGEILVARHTDPGWIALFSGAAGIVVERGSLLSHSAIVAREMGIPAIVALDGATSWLNTGDLLEMDGSTGVVRKCDAGPG